MPRDALRAVIDAAFQNVYGIAATGGFGDSRDSAIGHHDSAEDAVTLEIVLGERCHLHVSCYPYPAMRTTEKTPGEAARRTSDVEAVLILIKDVTITVAEREDNRGDADGQRSESQSEQRGKQQRAVDLVREENERFKAEISRIGGINRSLLASNQDLTDAVLELRRSNEELLVGHEEAEATAEEVKTLNEEMQATNEELVTINEELEATVEELHTANSDLQARSHELQQSSETLVAERAASEAARARLEAILLSLSDAVLVVDQTGTVILTNAAYGKMFGAADATFASEDDEGHPLPSEAAPQHLAAGRKIRDGVCPHRKRWQTPLV